VSAVGGVVTAAFFSAAIDDILKKRAKAMNDVDFIKFKEV
jgi:hypothetical protein